MATIAITDTSGYTNVPKITPPINIDLTVSIVEQKITGSVIKNQTITSAVKEMLVSILENVNLTATAKNKLAEYSGFAINETTKQIEFDSNKVTLDKLTFYVIFRLPYTNGTFFIYENIGNGDTTSIIPANPNTWGKYANYIRSLTGSGLKKINSAGEQVNNQGKPVDDNDNVIENWCSEKAYNYLGEEPFNGTYSIPAGLNSSAVEKAMLFGQNNEQPNAQGEVPLEFTKIPLYFYLLAKIENKYENDFWLRKDYNSKHISRIPHWPNEPNQKNYRKHFVKIKGNETDDSITEKCNILKDNGGHYIKDKTDKKIYIEPICAQALSFEGINLDTANELEKTTNGLLAIWNSDSNGKKIYYDHPIFGSNQNSGLTIGMGVDFGAGYNGIYEIQINISLSGTGTFRLYYGASKTQPININVTCKQLKGEIAKLLDIQPVKIKIFDSSNKENSEQSPVKITITRKYDAVNNRAYNHMIYAYNIDSTATVTLTPANESDRWKEISDSINDDWYYFNRFMNYSFTNGENGEPAEYYWLSQLNLSSQEQEAAKKTLKKSIGCRSKSGYHVFHENKELLKKLELKSYVRNLRATYHKIFIPRYYELTRPIKNGTADNAANQTIQYLLNRPALKTKPNQAELFAIALWNYNYPATYTRKIPDLITAINEHSMKKLNAVLNDAQGPRKEALKAFTDRDAVKSKLYHGLDD